MDPVNVCVIPRDVDVNDIESQVDEESRRGPRHLEVPRERRGIRGVVKTLPCLVVTQKIEYIVSRREKARATSSAQPRQRLWRLLAVLQNLRH